MGGELEFGAIAGKGIGQFGGDAKFWQGRAVTPAGLSLGIGQLQ